LTKDFTGYSELVINRGVGLARVSRIVLFQALPLMSQMLPFAVLVGVLVGLGRLASDLEILVISALGIEPRRLITPVALFGAGTALLALALAVFIAPWAQRGLDQALSEIAAINPAAEIRAGAVTRFGDWKLEAREVSSSGQQLDQVRLWIPSLAQTVFAKSADVGAADSGGLEIRLRDGVFLLNTRKAGRAMRFDEMRSQLPATSELAQTSREEELAGMSLSALSAIAHPANGDPEVAAQSELHRRFVLPVAALLFGVLGLPLALARTNASRSSGAVLGLLVTVGYYGLVQVAEGITQRNPSWVALASWLPNAALLALIALLYRRLARPWASEHLGGRSAPSPLQTSRAKIQSARGVRARRWPLSRYVAVLFLQLSLVCFAALVAAYLLVDILERLQWFARHAASAEEIVRFYSFRIPLLTGDSRLPARYTAFIPIE
jgi:lipopolysaccharide export system permease protein